MSVGRTLCGALWFWLVLYAAVLAAVTAGAFEMRRRMVAQLDTPQARAEWQAWKRETEEMARSGGPQTRRPARGDEPPALTLLRDYFPAVLGTLLLVASGLFAFAAFILYGMFGRPRSPSG